MVRILITTPCPSTGGQDSRGLDLIKIIYYMSDKMKKILLAVAAFLVTLAGGSQLDNIGAIEGRGDYRERLVMDAVTAVTTGTAFNVADFQNTIFTVATAPNGASSTLKFVCSMSESAPDFTVAPTVSNRWDYVEVMDLDDGTVVDGNAGLVFVNSTTVRHLKINSNLARWCTASLPAYTAGTTTVYMLNGNNN